MLLLEGKKDRNWPAKHDTDIQSSLILTLLLSLQILMSWCQRSETFIFEKMYSIKSDLAKTEATIQSYTFNHCTLKISENNNQLKWNTRSGKRSNESMNVMYKNRIIL